MILKKVKWIQVNTDEYYQKKNRKIIFDLNEKFSDSCHEKELNRNLGTE